MNASEPQLAALLKLLADDDAASVDLIKTQLARGGIAALPELRELERLATDLAAFHLLDVIAEIEESSAEQLLAQVCENFGEHGDIEEAAWRLGAVLAPGEDSVEARETLAAWGADVARRLPKAATAIDRVETLSEFLNFEQRVYGNDRDYYELRNSVLGSVVESGLGNPITVSLVYMLVARRAGMRVDGIALPGHFITRHEGVFFDPFHGGRQIGLKECRALLDQQNLTLTPAHLEPATPRQIFARMLTNVFHIAEQTDSDLARKLTGWIESLRRSADPAPSEKHGKSH
ncbi:MAG: transglutaminase-like domain-containing protein [Chthoniobacteraceae bacterium]